MAVPKFDGGRDPLANAAAKKKQEQDAAKKAEEKAPASTATTVVDQQAIMAEATKLLGGSGAAQSGAAATSTAEKATEQKKSDQPVAAAQTPTATTVQTPAPATSATAQTAPKTPDPDPAPAPAPTPAPAPAVDQQAIMAEATKLLEGNKTTTPATSTAGTANAVDQAAIAAEATKLLTNSAAATTESTYTPDAGAVANRNAQLPSLEEIKEAVKDAPGMTAAAGAGAGAIGTAATVDQQAIAKAAEEILAQSPTMQAESTYTPDAQAQANSKLILPELSAIVEQAEKGDVGGAAAALTKQFGLAETQAAENAAALSEGRRPVNTASATGLWSGTVSDSNFEKAPVSVIAGKATPSQAMEAASRALAANPDLGKGPSGPASDISKPDKGTVNPKGTSALTDFLGGGQFDQIFEVVKSALAAKYGPQLTGIRQGLDRLKGSILDTIHPQQRAILEQANRRGRLLWGTTQDLQAKVAGKAMQDVAQAEIQAQDRIEGLEGNQASEAMAMALDLFNKERDYALRAEEAEARRKAAEQTYSQKEQLFPLEKEKAELQIATEKLQQERESIQLAITKLEQEIAQDSDLGVKADKQRQVAEHQKKLAEIDSRIAENLAQAVKAKETPEKAPKVDGPYVLQRWGDPGLTTNYSLFDQQMQEITQWVQQGAPYDDIMAWATKVDQENGIDVSRDLAKNGVDVRALLLAAYSRFFAPKQ